MVDDLDVEALQRRTLRIVVASQVCGGAGLAAGVTVGGLLAKEMLGGDQVAGLPVALFTLGSKRSVALGALLRRGGRPRPLCQLGLSLGPHLLLDGVCGCA